MAVSIQELINQKEQIEAKKQETFDIKTSIGTLTVQKITKGLMADIMTITEGSDEYCILHTVISPNLQDAALQKAYGCAEPTDIVDKLFDAGEIPSIARKISQLSGYGKDIESKVHEDVKN
jgi:hypothetical protein|nr:MAG TPA: tail assembly chaperone protein [Caudoviricetes sp.]